MALICSVLVLFLFCFAFAFGDLIGPTVDLIPADQNQPITVSMSIDSINEKITITMTGPLDVWYGVGFGGDVMANTYSLISDINCGSIHERKLGGKPRKGVTVGPSEGFTVDSDICDSNNNQRTVTVTRDLVSQSSDIYTFLNGEQQFPCIGGYGKPNEIYEVPSGMGGHSNSGLSAPVCTICYGQNGECSTLHPTALPTQSPTYQRCLTVEGPNQPSSEVSCPEPYALLSCGIKTDTNNHFGSFIDKNHICHAEGAGNVVAVAQCCYFTGGAPKCNIANSEVGLDEVTAVCSNKQVVVGCSVTSDGTIMDGSCPGNQCDTDINNIGQLLSYDALRCTAINGNGNTQGVTANARCCGGKVGNGRLSCRVLYSPFSGFNENDMTVAKCPKNQDLVGCSGFATTLNGGQLKAWYIENEECKAVNGPGGGQVQAVAICCAEKIKSPKSGIGNFNVNKNNRYNDIIQQQQQYINKDNIYFYIFGVIGMIMIIVGVIAINNKIKYSDYQIIE